MTKREFIKIMDSLLIQIPETNQDNYIFYMEIHFWMIEILSGQYIMIEIVSRYIDG